MPIQDGRPHIMVFSTSTLDYGGAETSLAHFIHWVGGRYHFTLLGQASPVYQDYLARLGVAYRPWGPVTPRAFSPAAIFRLYRLLAVDLVYTLDARASTLAGPAAMLAGIPYLHHKHSSPLYYRGVVGIKRACYRLGEALLAWLMMDAQVFPSHKVYEQYVRGGLCPARKSHYIPNAYHIPQTNDYLAQRDSRRADLGLGPESFVWILVGRLSYEKAHDILLQALAQLPPDSDWFLWLVGGGEKEGAIRALCSDLGLEARVRFWGVLTAAEVYGLLAASDAFVLPSRFENMPLVLLEALQLERPCIVTPVGDSWALVGEGDLPPAGLVVPTEDVAALSQALTLMMADKRQYQAFQAACAARVAPYTPERHFEALGGLMESLLEQKKQTR